VSQDSSDPKALQRLAYLAQAARLRALAAEAKSAKAREHFIALAVTYETLAGDFTNLPTPPKPDK
jgi:hypothetical protein